MNDALNELRKMDAEFVASAEGYGHSLLVDLAEILWNTGLSEKELAKKLDILPVTVSRLIHAQDPDFDLDLALVGQMLHRLGIKPKLIAANKETP